MRALETVWNRAKGGAVVLMAPLALTTAACAQDQSPQAAGHEAVASETGAIEFLPDADVPSSEWVVENPDGFAVAIRYGGATEYPPELIQDVLEGDLTAQGITNIRFFWEHGLEDGGTSITYETRNNGFGPYGLTEGRRQIPQVVRAIEFDRNIGVASLTGSID